MARRGSLTNFNRREFMEMTAGAGVVCAATSLLPEEFIQATQVGTLSGKFQFRFQIQGD